MVRVVMPPITAPTQIGTIRIISGIIMGVGPIVVIPENR